MVGTSGSRAAVPLDAVVDCLARGDRRRPPVRLHGRAPDSTTVEGLVAWLAGRTGDASGEEVTDVERRRPLALLRHVHLPTSASADPIERDDDERAIVGEGAENALVVAVTQLPSPSLERIDGRAEDLPATLPI